MLRNGSLGSQIGGLRPQFGSILGSFWVDWNSGPSLHGFLRAGVKMGPHFPAKSDKIIVLYSLFEPLGTLQSDPADLPEMESGLAEQTLGSPRRGAG